MSLRAPQRRSPPIVIWLMLGVTVVLILIGAVLGLLTWQEMDRVGVLRAEVASLRSERQQREAQYAILQSTAVAMGDRLGALEASVLSQQQSAQQR